MDGILMMELLLYLMGSGYLRKEEGENTWRETKIELVTFDT